MKIGVNKDLPCWFDVDLAHGWNSRFHDAFSQYLQSKGNQSV
jgi:hypothetical protein